MTYSVFVHLHVIKSRGVDEEGLPQLHNFIANFSGALRCHPQL